MKKILPLIVIVLLVMSCQNDDDVTVEQCSEPTNIQSNTITSVSATITWSDANTSATYSVEYGVSGFSIGSGTTIDTDVANLAINGLQANTVYDVYITSICSISNISMESDVASFTTLAPPVIPQFLPLLSQLNLFSGDLSNLELSSYAFEYDLNTRLYTDYAQKQRIVALPLGTSMQYDGNGMPIFPNGTVIAKTFFYNNNEQDLSAGRQLIETRILLRLNDQWEIGNYLWNNEQTDADLDDEAHTIPISWINEMGNQVDINYEVPNNNDCITCHQTFGDITPIGTKLRSMNFNNQLQFLISDGHLTNAPDPGSITVLPSWEDASFSDEIRTRAYFDVNCAHCHSPGGFHNENYFDAMDLNFETSFDDSNIFNYRFSMQARLPTSIEGYSMPFLGVSLPHQEALDLIIPYLESLN